MVILDSEMMVKRIYELVESLRVVEAIEGCYKACRGCFAYCSRPGSSLEAGEV
jgi:hypothetical protein